MKDIIWSDFDSIKAVMCFGSKARGDNDKYSDSDIFILCEDIEFNEIVDLKNNLSNLLNMNPSNFSIYRFYEFSYMIENGSLFLWHLKLEGKVIFSKMNIEDCFEKLSMYKDYKKNILTYEEIFLDCKRSIYNNINVFDLSILFTICRNLCMNICYKLGQPAFGRMSAYYKAKDLLKEKILLSESNYILLSSAKLLYNRGLKTHELLLDLNQIDQIIYEINNLINIGKEICFYE